MKSKLYAGKAYKDVNVRLIDFYQVTQTND